MPARLIPALVAALLCAALSWMVREAASQRFAGAPGTAHEGSWFSAEPDGLYHLRRVQRAAAGNGTIAGEDPALNAPAGAAIPWPPYYDQLLLWSASLVGIDPVAEPEALEHFAATLPQYFGALTSALAALLAYGLTRRFRFAAALAAGTAHGACFAAAHYAAPGSADHHAWVSLLTLALCGTLSLGLRHGAMWRSRPATLTGLGGGALCGLLIGSWVAGLIALLVVQAVFAWLLAWQKVTPRPLLGRLGFGFHLALAVTLLPAVLASPWRFDHPWMVVNLSWFHLLEALLGALVFAPLLRDPEGRRWHPLWIPAALLVLGGGLVALGVGPGAGIREGFSWASRADAFMAGITESEPLWGTDRTGSGGALRWIGYGLWLLPLAWAWIMVQAFWKGRSQHLVWAIVVPVFLLQALAQRRFAEALAAPMAIVLALFLAESLLPRLLGRVRRGAPAIAAVVAVVFGAGQHGAQAVGGVRALADLPRSHADNYQAGLLHAAEWLGRTSEEAPVVLAPWDLGHLLEWRAGARTLATNFGSYVGEDGFRAPARYLLTPRAEGSGADVGEDQLEARQVDYVLLPARLTWSLDDLVRRALPDQVNPFVEVVGEGSSPLRRSRLTPAWFTTIAASLLTPTPPTGQAPLDHLRLVYLCPIADSDPRHGSQSPPSALIWQRVAGARLTIPAPQSEDRLVVRFPVQVRWQNQELLRFDWRSETLVKNGALQLRVPYATGDQGMIRAGRMHWQLWRGDRLHREGDLSLSETQVRLGDSVPLIQ